jgi:hypothetical protein
MADWAPLAAGGLVITVCVFTAVVGVSGRGALSGCLKTSHIGIPTQAAKQAAASGMLSQNQYISPPQ